MPAADTRKTMALRDVGSVLVFFHSKESPSDAEWDHALEVYRHISNLSKSRVFVFTEGAAPNAAQRARMNAVIGDAKSRISLVTPSTFARAAGTAIRWFNPGFRIFAPTEMDDAFEHLSASPAERRLIERALEELRTEVVGLERKTGG